MDFLSNQYYQQLAMFIIINAILGISIYLTLSTGQLSLGNAGFMSIGAYTSALLTIKAGFPIYLSIPVGGIAACLIALVIGLPTTRLQGIYLAIATLGFGEVVRVIILNLKITNGALGLSGIPSISVVIGKNISALGMGDGLFGLNVQQLGNFSVIFILLAILLFLVFFTVRLNHSRIGRAFAAIKADDHAAEVSGINTTAYKLLAFFLGAFVAFLRLLRLGRACANVERSCSEEEREENSNPFSNGWHVKLHLAVSFPVSAHEHVDDNRADDENG